MLTPLKRFGYNVLVVFKGRQEVFTMAGLHGWITVASAAKRLGVSKQAVYQRIKRGTLESRVLYGKLIVSTRSVEALLRDRMRRFEGGVGDETTRSD